MRIFRICIVYFLRFSAVMTALHIILEGLLDFSAVGYFVIYNMMFILFPVMSIYFIMDYFLKKKELIDNRDARTKIKFLFSVNILLVALMVAIVQMRK